MLTSKIPRNLLKKCINPTIFEATAPRNIQNHQNDSCATFTRLYSQNPGKLVKNANIEPEITPVNKFVQRSHTCGELTAENVGEHVQLCGWMEFQRMGKFITLRDSYGSTQLIIPEHKVDLMRIVDKLSFESVLCVTGKVVPRPQGQENHKMKTGAIEIEVDNLEVLNKSVSQLPFSIREHNVPKEALQMQFRYLALRFPYLQRNLRLRSQILNRMRFFLADQCGFVDVETPTLFRRTPGGAQEFVVPTQHKGKFYSLVQSPQQFKQLLMIGGIDKYFQIARCYRDETSRPDRQPEFTQLDIEMSFTNREGIMALVEQLVEHCIPKEFGEITTPFRRYTYEEIMETFGTDQPDLRIPFHFHNVTNLHKNFGNNSNNEELTSVYALSVPQSSEFLTNSVKSQLNKFTNDFNYQNVSLNQIKITGDDFLAKLEKTELNVPELKERLKFEENDVVFVVRGDKEDARKLLGKVLLEFTNVIEAKGTKVRSEKPEFLWIIDFPLFEEGEEHLGSTHHPFTAPHPEDAHLLNTDPLKVRGLHYDLVLNGSEIAGGSMRIHDAELQEKVLKMLNIETTQMTHLIEALKSGAPPHGGIAFGLDRLISIICGEAHIRNVIAFPKTMEGKDLMSGAPAEISTEEKKLYHVFGKWE